MTNIDIKSHQHVSRNELLVKIATGLRPVLLLTSYCGEEDGCTDQLPCDDCLKMCNVAVIDPDIIEMKDVIAGFNYLKD